MKTEDCPDGTLTWSKPVQAIWPVTWSIAHWILSIPVTVPEYVFWSALRYAARAVWKPAWAFA